jgi:hypothetical protein
LAANPDRFGNQNEFPPASCIMLADSEGNERARQRHIGRAGLKPSGSPADPKARQQMNAMRRYNADNMRTQRGSGSFEA